MNIINKFLLNAVLFPQALYTKMGVNMPQLRAIISTKLIMDDRRPNTFRQMQQNKKDKPVKSATLGTIVMAAFIGFFFLYAFRVGKDYATHLTIYFSIYIFMLASTLIADFTSVLIDVRDNYIILPKPVNDKTVVVARLLHILIHVTRLIVPMSVPAIVFMTLNTSIWGAVLFSILIALSTLFTIFLINAIYIFILKITTPQKFQSVISYLQVGFAIFIYGGYQIALRAVNEVAIQGYSVATVKYIWLAPPWWFAGAWQGLSTFHLQPQWLAPTLLSFITPFASIYVVIKYFAPSFNQKLSQITAANAETTPIKNGGKTVTGTSVYSSTLAKWVTQKGAEQMGFLFCWKMTSRSKDFLMKVYPSFGYVAVYVVILFMNSKTLSWQTFRNDPSQAKIILLSIIYASSLMLVMAITQAAYSEKFKAAWFYFTTPVKEPGLLISGALKAVTLKYVIPIIAIITLPAILLMGLPAIPNLLFGVSNLLLICAVMAYINNKYLPFSANQSMAVKSGAFLRGLSSLIVPGIIGLIHYALYQFTIVVGILSVLSLAAAWLVIGSIKKTSWVKVKSTYE